MQLFSYGQMASGMDHGHVHPTTKTNDVSHNMAAIQQMHQVIQSWITAYIFNIRHAYYVQLTAVIKKSADQYQVTISRAQV